eukprot:979093_1
MKHHNDLEYQKNQLKHHVALTENMNDLLLMIQHFPLSSIKQFANDQIENLNSVETASACWNVLSINDMLLDDPLQLILSFVGLYCPRLVCKKWQKFSVLNETIHIARIYESANIKKHSNKENKTWIVHPRRPYLHTIEKDLGLHGPINTFPYASVPLGAEHASPEHLEVMINSLNNGDTLLLHDGRYWKYRGFNFEKSVQFIGLGNDVRFKKEPEDGASYLVRMSTSHPCNMYFENIIFESVKELYSKKTRTCIDVGRGNTLTMKRCTLITSGTGIWLGSASSLVATNCRVLSYGFQMYVGGSHELMAWGSCGIYVAGDSSKATIRDCLFRDLTLWIVKKMEAVFALILRTIRRVHAFIWNASEMYLKTIKCIRSFNKQMWIPIPLGMSI